MILAVVLAGLMPIGDLFLSDFGGVWTCGNANYHERWDIHALAGHPGIAEVAYGNPNTLDGFAFVYFSRSEGVFHYDDFHADGAQSHLTAAVPPPNGVWDWVGSYEPVNEQIDPNPDITWTRTPQGTIERHFRKKTNGTPMEQGNDICTRSS